MIGAFGQPGAGDPSASTRPPGTDPLAVSQYGHYRVNPDGSVTQDIVQDNPQLDNEIRKTYGYEAWMLNIPELKAILYQATGPEPWDPARIQGAIEQTQWFNTHSANQREWAQLAGTDTQTARDKVERATNTIHRMVDEMGLNVDGSRVAGLAQTALENKWSPEEIRSALAHEGVFDPNKPRGTSGDMAQRFKQMAGDYLIPVSDDTISHFVANSLASGKADESGFQAYAQQMSGQLYPWMQSLMKSDPNLRPMHIVEPYRQHIARTLEVDPQTIDFTNPKWQKTITTTDQKTGEAQAAPLWQVERTLKSDPNYGWQFTGQANAMAGQLETKILSSFGQIP
jgi:hypothetical protein